MVLKKSLFALPEGYDLRVFDHLDSTNLECRRYAEAGATGHIWVVADAQSAGKGRRGRQWVSRPGNLFASLLYAVDCDLGRISQLSFVAALAVRDVVADRLPSGAVVRCKWPNDILVDGRKISGILLETAGNGGEMPSHMIIGIGINIAHHPDDGQYPATDLMTAAGQEIDRQLVLDRLIHAMDHWISSWKEQGFPLIRQAWKDGALGLGQDIIVRLPAEELRGRFVDLDETGALILEFGGERRHISAGDVFFAPD